MDESKNTEHEGDISRSEFTETQSQETLRNLHRNSAQKETLERKKVTVK